MHVKALVVLFLLLPVFRALHKGALTHLKEQKLFQLCFSIVYWKLGRLWSTHSITFLYANPGGCLNSGDKILGKQHHKNLKNTNIPQVGPAWTDD